MGRVMAKTQQGCKQSFNYMMREKEKEKKKKKKRKEKQKISVDDPQGTVELHMIHLQCDRKKFQDRSSTNENVYSFSSISIGKVMRILSTVSSILLFLARFFFSFSFSSSLY
jgi:hypothetical protein